MDNYFVYVVECGDGTFYTGITNDLDKRLEAHNSGRGAKYTRGRGPVKLHYFESHPSKSEAAKREHQIKKLTRQKKADLSGVASKAKLGG